MRIIHMSDLHLTSDRHPIWGVDTYKQFVKTLEKIGTIPHVDCIVVSGDIANDGNIQTYQYADDMLNSFSTPVLWCPGNHDNVNTLYDYAKVSRSIIGVPMFIKGFRILPLNTVAPDNDDPNHNRSRGFFCNEEFQYLKKQLVDQQIPTILVMHHPSINPGGWMTNKILHNREIFNDTIRKYDNIFLILYGHIHFHMKHQQSGKTFISAPSIGFAFHKDLAKYEIDKGEEGFLLIDIDKRTINVQVEKV